MEKITLVIIGSILVVVLSFSFLNFTGNVTNEAGGVIGCNPADFNGDGMININDKMAFGEVYALDYASQESCSRADLNKDGIISYLDNNEFNRIYLLNDGEKTGRCVLKKLVCEEPEVVEEEVVVLEEEPSVGELPPEKIGFFQWIKNFFKSLVGK